MAPETPSPPPHRSLLIPEILERILIQLDIHTLLFSQRVCTAWASLMQQSPSLQQALFFAPAQWPKEDIIYNPLLIKHFPPFFPGTIHNELVKPRDCYPPHFLPMQYVGNENAWSHPVKDDLTRAEVFYSELPLQKYPLRRKAYLYPEASWRRMLTQQPPAPHIPVLRVWSWPRGKTFDRYRIPGTLKDVMDLERYVQQNLKDSEPPDPSSSPTNNLEDGGGVTMGLLFDYVTCDLDLKWWMIMWGDLPPVSMALELGPEYVDAYKRAAEDGSIVILTFQIVQGAEWWYDIAAANAKNLRFRIVDEYRARGWVGERPPTFSNRLRAVENGRFPHFTTQAPFLARYLLPGWGAAVG
ncbi:uncharacterized protein BO87DRAFT_381174 [Aspergillus neoniger CBS 115656]|uniref:F-box domain-containing protein n=1 Tax=Aspergillus neoniger (strain CBS 115656) TaxID=1448310 RepID=A0A318Y2T6_ASPNB|nr:hypothetical protein BO87DRAFT_381174 [Aspergillus neoniger CBS 115656]PYH28645.1 hypothetical protein BO87DRAFT_381174 [Aspergillus neoniger CBS 115656]